MHKNKFRFAIVLFATLSVLIMGFSSLKTASAASCGTPNVTTNPSGSASKGTSVTISASVTCDGGVGKMEIRVGMSTLATNSGSSSISATWNTGNADVGNVRIYVNAWPNGSDSPFDKGSQQVDYTITQGSGGGNPTQPPPPQVTNPPPQATFPPNPNGKCTITSIRTNPSGSARRGAVVNISATSSCSGGTGKMEIVVGMSVVARNSGSASISVNWNSSNGYIGNNNIYVSAYANGNDSEFDKAKGDLNFILTEGNPPPQATAPPAFTPRPSDPTATQYVALGPLYPQAKTDDGGIHTDNYCKAKYGQSSHAELSSDDAYSHRCLVVGQDQPVYIDFQLACLEVYGATAPYAVLGDSYNNAGWKCQASQGYVDPPHSGGRPAPTKGAITSTPIPPLPPSGNCDGVYASRLSVGMRGEVIRDGRGPTTLRSGPSVTYGTIVSMPEGTQFNVIGGPECASTRSGINVYFWKLKLDNGTEGWAVEHIDGNYAIGPVSSAGIITATSALSYDEVISCQSGQSHSDSGTMNVVYLESDFVWCTEFVIGQYPKLQKCWGGFPNAYLWDNWATDPTKTPSRKNCNLSVNSSQNGKTFDWKDIRIGDVVVWEPYCAAARDVRGHVAVVVGLENPAIHQPQKRDYVAGPVKANILVDEANGDGHGQVARSVMHGVYSGCMSFIHIPDELK